MFADRFKSRASRRGIILVLVLGMLALLALLGVTFATFSGQAMINARNANQAQYFPDSDEMFDYALAQLIEDTANPASVIRGHSLKRDMYGNDAWSNGALLNGFPDGSGPIVFTSVSLMTSGNYSGYVQCVTNIPTNSAILYGSNFTRWIVKFPGQFVANYQYNATIPAQNSYVVGQTYEIIADETSGSARTFYLAPPYPLITANESLTTTPGSSLEAMVSQITGYTSYETNPAVSHSILRPDLPPTSVPILLDGRYLRAFNGPGLSTLGVDSQGHPLTEYANFRYNGAALLNNLVTAGGTAPAIQPAFGDPNAAASAGFSGMPSMDEDYDAVDLENWFLAIQSADGQVIIPSFHRPGLLAPQDWHPSLAVNAGGYGADNVAITRSYSKLLRPRAFDGHSPISFPDLVPDATTGQIRYDVDNDGDGITDAVWLDLGYPAMTSTQGQVFKPLFAFTVLGLNGRLPLNTAGNLQNLVDRQSGQPNFEHASHLGNSPSEIDLTYALQNAYDPTQATNNPFTFTPPLNPYTQVDSANDTRLPVNLTQLRNILTGTRLPDPSFDPNSAFPSPPMLNGDLNVVMVNGRKVLLPNNVGDPADFYVPSPNGPAVLRATQAIAGRWGEEGGVPQRLRPATPASTGPPATPILYDFNNPIRAGLSYVSNGAFDIRDDNNNTFDTWPSVTTAEQADYYDASGSLSFPVERIRRFVTPIDLAGDGRLLTFGNGSGEQDGADEFGRVAFFHYFRPPGMLVSASTIGVPSLLATSAGNSSGSSSTTNYMPVPDRVTNHYHGYESFRNPVQTGNTAVRNSLFDAAMPANLNGTSATVPVAVYPGGTANPGTPMPTFTFGVNSDVTGVASSAQGASNPAAVYISPGLNEADEMTLYQSSASDAPFGPGDLQWLYRLQDVDGASLSSRLPYLAPISFMNSLDGVRRRRLFARSTPGRPPTSSGPTTTRATSSRATAASTPSPTPVSPT